VLDAAAQLWGCVHMAITTGLEGTAIELVELPDFELSPNARFSSRREAWGALGHLVGPSQQVLRISMSLCPDCVEEHKWDTMKIPSVIYEEKGEVWLTKECREHGVTTDKYWEDTGMYLEAERNKDSGLTLANPHVDFKASKIDCPRHCGLCVKHKSHTGLGNIVVTNRCDLACWYCFFYAKEGEPIYEPTMEQIRKMLRKMRDEKPVGANAVQITGGEPTVREDILEIVKMAREEGYEHVQLNSDGINLSRKPELAAQVRASGSNVLYMSFDGVTAQTNGKNYYEAPFAIENARKAGLGIVLVPTVIGGVNDHQLGDILRWGMANIDTIRAVNFQPVSLVGRMPAKQRMAQRVTIPGCIKRIEAQTEGQITRQDFFTVPSTTKLTNFIEAMTGEDKYRLSIHFACGAGTYVFPDGKGGFIPVTRFIDVQGVFEWLDGLATEINQSRFKKAARAKAGAEVLLKMGKFIDDDKLPPGLSIRKILWEAFMTGTYDGLKEFHYKSMFIGFMHFMDPYNYDVDRVERCDIHYAMPDGRVIPFCAFNVIPELYRDKVQRKYSVSAEEWEQTNGKKLASDKFKRNYTEEYKRQIQEIYLKALGRPPAQKPGAAPKPVTGLPVASC